MVSCMWRPPGQPTLPTSDSALHITSGKQMLLPDTTTRTMVNSKELQRISFILKFYTTSQELNNNKPAKRSIHWKTKNNYIQHNYVTHNKVKQQIVHRYTAATTSLTYLSSAFPVVLIYCCCFEPVVYIHTQLGQSLSPHRPLLQRDSMYACLLIYIT